MRKLIFALLLLAGYAHGQIKLVAHTSVGWSSGSNILPATSPATATPPVSTPPVTTPPIDTTGATTLIACTSSSGDAYHYSPASVTDSMNNQWSLVLQQNAAGYMRLAMWKSIAATMSATHTFTFAAAKGFKNPSGIILAFSGIASGPDQTAKSMTLSTPITFGLTPSLDNELIVSCASIMSMTQATPSTPYVQAEYLPEAPDGTKPYSYQQGAAYLVQAKAAPSSVKWNNVNPATGGTMGSGSAGISASFYSTLSPAPLAVTRPTEGFAGQSYAYQMSTTGGVAPFKWTITAGALPPGLTLNTNGWITGTGPTATKTTATFHVVDAQNNTADETFPFVIADKPPAFVAVVCPIGHTYLAYSCDVSPGASGGTPPYIYRFDMANSEHSGIPEGTSFTSTGMLSGTLTGMGDFYPHIIVTDSYGNSSQVTFAAKQLIRVVGNAVWAKNVFPQDSIFHHKINSLPVDRVCADGSKGNNCPLSPLGHLSSMLKDPGAPSVEATKIWVNYVGTTGDPDHPQYCCGIPIYKVPFDQAPNPNLYQRPAARGSGYQTYFADNWFSKYHGALNSDGCVPAKFPDHWAQDGSRQYDLCAWNPPIPLDAPIEATFVTKKDSHVLVYQEAGGGHPARLHEIWGAKWQTDAGIDCGLQPCDFSKLSYASATLWPNVSDTSTSPGAYQMPPYSYGTADAAGLPITPFLLTVDEVIGTGTPLAPNGVIRHPIRMTLESHGCKQGNCLLKTMVWPATRAGGDRASGCNGGYQKGTWTSNECQKGYGACDANYISLQSAPPTSCTSTYNPDVGPAWGEMFRIRADVPEPPCMATNPMSRIIFQAMKDYGVIFADIGGSGNLQAVPDDRWYWWTDSTTQAGHKVTDVPLCFNGKTNGLPNVNLGMLEPVDVSGIIADTLPVTGKDGRTYQMPWTYRTIEPKLASVRVTPAMVNVPIGKTQQFTAACVYSDQTIQDCTGSAVWSSSNKVATVSPAGLTTAISSGTATISANVDGITGSTSMETTSDSLNYTTKGAPGELKNISLR